MSNLSPEFREYEVDDLEALMGDGSGPQIHTGDEFDLHPQSESTVDSLDDLRRLCHIPPEVEMIVLEPFESPESGREGYCCAYEIYFKVCGLFFPLPEILLAYLNHLGIAFSQMSPNMLRYLLCTFTVAAEAGYLLGLCELLELFQARESRTSGYYALYPIADRNLIDGLPLKDNAWRKFWFFFRINNFSIQNSSELLRVHWSLNLGPQIRPVPSIDFLNFYKAVLERPVNWNSFTLERIHGAGFSVRMGLTNPVDPPPAGIGLSSLNARDRRKIKEANKKIKDQISLVGRDKKNATSTGDDKVYRKTLLVDDGSLEGSKSMAVAVNNASPSIPAADNVVAATVEEEGLASDSSLMKKRKAEELEPLPQGRPKSTRKGRAAPSNLSIPEPAEAQDANPDSGTVSKEPLASGMLPPRRPRGNTSRVRSSPSSGLVARASSQADKKNATSTGDDKVYRKTLLVDDGSLEGSKSMAVAVNNASPSIPAADNVVAATVEEEGLASDSSLMKKRKAEELEPLPQGRPKSTRKGRAAPSNLSIPEPVEAQDANPDSGTVSKEPLASGMLPPRRPRGNTSRVRSSPSSGLVARASSQADKKNATSTGDDKVYRKTLLVDDGSLEGSKSMAVAVNNASPSIPAADNVVAATVEEEGLASDSSLMKKRKAEELEPLPQGRPKSTRKGRAAPSNLSIPEPAEAQDANPDSGTVSKEPLASGMLPPRRPRGNTSRVRSSPSSGLVARASSQADKKNATSTGDDKVYRKTLLVDDGSLEGSKSMAVAVNNASPSIAAADNVVAATVEEEGLASDSSLMKKRKAEELEPLPKGRPKSTRKGRAAPSNLSIPEPAEAQDANPDSGTVSKEPLASGMLPPRRPRGNTSRVRSSPSSGLVARASSQADKKNATSTGDDKVYRKTLLVDDGSLEGSKSMAVAVNNASPSIPAADNVVAATVEEEGLASDSSLMKKRKAEELEPLPQGRPKSTRKGRAAPSNLSIPEPAEAQDANPDSGTVSKEPLASGMLPPRRPRGNTSRVRSSPSSGLVARASSQADKKNATSTGDDKVYRKTLLVDDGSLEGSKSMAVAVNNASPSIPAADNVVAATVEEEGLASDSSLMKKRKAEELEPLPQGRPKSTRKGRAAPSNLSIPEPAEAQDANPDSGTVSKEPLASGMLPPRRPRGNTSRVRSSPSSGLVARASSQADKKNATSTGDDKVYRKTLLVDDGSLEGSKSMAVAVNNASPSIPAEDNVVAATVEEEGLASDSSLMKKRKAEELEPLPQGRPKSTRKGRAAPSNLSIPEPAEAQDANPDSGTVSKEPLASGMLPPRRPRGNTSRVRSSPSSGLVARASSQADKKNATSTGDDKVYRKTLLVDDGSLEGSKSMAVAVNNASPSIAAADNVVAATVEEEGLASDSSLMKKRKAEELEPLPKGRPKSTRKGRAAPSNLSIPEPAEAQDANPDSGTVSKEPLASGMLPPRRPRGNTSRVRSSPSSGLVARASSQADKKNATSTGDDKVYRKTLLVDDGSLEGSKSMAVAVNNASPSIPAADNVVAATVEEEGLASDSSLMKKRKAEELEPLPQGRPKSTRKGRAAPSNLSIPEPAEAQDANPDSGTVSKEPLASGMLPPRRPRGNTSRVRSSPSSGLVARASSQADKKNATSTGDDKVYRKTLLVDDGSLEGSKSMAVAVNNASPSIPAADNVVAATVEEEGLASDSSLMKKRKAEELEPLPQGRPKSTRKGRAAPSNLSIPEPAEAQDANPDSGTVSKEPLASGMLPPRRPRGNTSRVRSSPSSGLVARASSQADKKNATSTGDDKVYRKTLLVDDGSLEGSKSMAVAVNNASPSIPAADNVVAARPGHSVNRSVSVRLRLVAATVEEEGLASDSSLMKKRKAEELEPLPQGRPKSTRKGRAAPSNLSIPEPAEAQDANPDSGTVSKEPLASGMLPPRRPRGNTSRVRSSPSSGLVARASSQADKKNATSTGDDKVYRKTLLVDDGSLEGSKSMAVAVNNASPSIPAADNVVAATVEEEGLASDSSLMKKRKAEELEPLPQGRPKSTRKGRAAPSNLSIPEPAEAQDANPDSGTVSKEPLASGMLPPRRPRGNTSRVRSSPSSGLVARASSQADKKNATSTGDDKVYRKTLLVDDGSLEGSKSMAVAVNNASPSIPAADNVVAATVEEEGLASDSSLMKKRKAEELEPLPQGRPKSTRKGRAAPSNLSIPEPAEAQDANPDSGTVSKEPLASGMLPPRRPRGNTSRVRSSPSSGLVARASSQADKKNATSTGDDKVYRKTLLVDDGSLEGSKSMAVAVNNASPSIPAADNVVAATVEEEGLASDSSLMKKRKAEELEPLPQGRPKSTRKGRAAPSNLSIPEPAEAQDANPDSGTVSKEPLASGMLPPRRPRGNTSRVRSSPSSGLVARASSQADKKNATSTGDDKVYRKTLLVDDGSLEGSKSMAVAVNNASPSIPAADNVVAATVEEEGLASDSSLMKKRKAEELEPLPQGRPKSTRKGRAAPSNLSIPEPDEAQDANPDSGTVSKEPLASGMLPPRRPRGNTSRVRSSPSSGLVARASSQADKKNATSTGDDKVYRKTLLVDDGSLEGSKSMAVAVNNASPSIPAADNVVAATVEEEGLASDSSLMKKRKAEELEPLPQGRPKSTRKGRAAPSNLSIPEPAEAQDANPDSGTVSKEPLASGMLPPRRPRGNTSRVRSSPSSGLVARASSQADKKNATSTGDDKVYRKTLLVDDGSLEGSKSMAVAVNNASPSIPAADNVVAATVEEEGLASDSSLMKKRKAEELEPLPQGRPKSTRKGRAAPSNLSIPEPAEAQDANPDSGTVSKEPLASGMLPPRRPRGNTSRVRSSPSSGLVARASSQADKKNATSTGDDKVYRKTLLVDDGSLEGSKSMAVAVNNASPSIPAADNVVAARPGHSVNRSVSVRLRLVAATVEEEGLASDSSLMKKRKAEELEPLPQGRPKSTRKGRAAPSNLSIPEPAEAQDANPDSGTVSKEPLASGMLPPRRPRGNTSRVLSSPSSGLVARASSQADKEKIGNMFRCFHTRVGKKLPSFDWWKPDIKKMYISHSFHSSQATLDVNGIVNYEEELAKVSKKVAAAEGEIEKLQSSTRLVQETAGLDSARREEIERLKRSGEETRKTLIETEQKLETALADHNFAKGEIELLRSELNKVKAAAEELERKNESLSELKDRDVRKISHDARKEVKGAGQKFLLAVQDFIAADKAWNKLNSERDEMKSNLDLIKEIEDRKVNLAEEKETVGAELAETEAKLNTAPQPYLNLQQFASEFADSPPLTEPNIGSSLDEMMLTGSPRAHFNEFGTNVDRISSGRAQGLSDQGLVISSIMGDDVESRNETPQDVSSLNPEVVLATQDDDVRGALVSSQAREEGRDGFTPQGVAIPSFLSSMSREEKIECHEFMEQITERYVFLCSERQRLGRKRHVLEERIARTERKIRRLESDVHNWERRGFDSIARIPSCLREHIRFLKKHWDIYQRSLEPDEREGEGNSSEKPFDSSKLISDDLPGAPDIELTKTGRTGEPEGSRRLRKGTSIQVPIVLIERLSAQDRVKAEEFINKLITRHDELEDEKKEIRKKRRELGKRCLDIARELHCLEAHPSDWIELGLREYENMPSCIMSIVDLAGQGAELFRNSRPF
ncbi:hypothetical protein ISN44_As13g009570 [Arabidopsis suecica]|uniref:Uncharacterized protein n=1 Tax=Arabidopsis suecica TaxID=45249 RepID=A0A8T1XQV1_ARASU|nr:hypothetical protein ISN44_As13g009570 [Arabidopsis suecica]